MIYKDGMGKGGVDMSKKLNRYELVHEIARLAKEKEVADREAFLYKDKNQIYKTINESKTKRNYVLEAFEELTNENKNNEQTKADEE